MPWTPEGIANSDISKYQAIGRAMGGAFFGTAHGPPTPCAPKIGPDYAYLKILLMYLRTFRTVFYKKN